jgi:hypothetical protein
MTEILVLFGIKLNAVEVSLLKKGKFVEANMSCGDM